jgi:hypothetical protein
MAAGILAIASPFISSWLFWTSFRSDQPVMAFLNERYELLQTFEDEDIPFRWQEYAHEEAA